MGILQVVLFGGIRLTYKNWLSENKSRGLGSTGLASPPASPRSFPRGFSQYILVRTPPGNSTWVS